jgi:GH15 family glucan-1,4-alpha-glucosidase
MEYPLIADHGLIGDLETAALVATDGSIDWFCAPRFDSPSIFGALLDSTNGGRFLIRPVDDAFTTKQLYFPDTAILITRFMTEGGVGEVVDFMPALTSGVPSSRHRIVRMVRCIRGSMRFRVAISPRFGYGLTPSTTDVTDSGAVFKGPHDSAVLHTVREPDDERVASGVMDDNGDLHVTVDLRAGDVRGMILETGTDNAPREVRVAEVLRLFEDTVRFWRSWVAASSYTGRWREMVARSAITLKLMTYAPSGGLVAAPTAGLPEQIGGERNWDYRYTWVRDASFSVHSLLRLGYLDEAASFATWLRDRVQDHAGTDSPLKIMYRVDGSSDLTETILTHWEGYRRSSPVRIGNGASDQLQLDIYGEALDALYYADQRGLRVGHHGWQALTQILDWLCDNWDRPDEGIWETRGGQKDFTYGRVMSWVALDRAVRLADRYGRPAPLERWRQQRDAVYEQVMARGWNPRREAFVQEYGGEVLDSSLLRMPAVGFVSATDPMWASTLRAMDQELVTDSLVYRYDPAASPDGLLGAEGTFSLCTFGYVDALARSGRLDEARLTFEKMLTYANHLGLYSEEIALTGEQIGNFPQAFTHLSLIDAAVTLNTELDRPSRRTRTFRVPPRQPTTSTAAAGPVEVRSPS